MIKNFKEFINEDTWNDDDYKDIELKINNNKLDWKNDLAIINVQKNSIIEAVKNLNYEDIDFNIVQNFNNRYKISFGTTLDSLLKNILYYTIIY